MGRAITAGGHFAKGGSQAVQALMGGSLDVMPSATEAQMIAAGAGSDIKQVLGRSAGGIAKHVAQITRALDGDGLQIDVACPPGLPVEMPKPTQMGSDVACRSAATVSGRSAATSARSPVTPSRLMR